MAEPHYVPWNQQFNKVRTHRGLAWAEMKSWRTRVFPRQGGRRGRSRHSGEQLLDHFAADGSEALVTALVLVSQLRVVDSQAMQDGGLQVVDVDGVFNNVIAIIIRLAETDAWLDAAARHPDAEAAWVMVAPV